MVNSRGFTPDDALPDGDDLDPQGRDPSELVPSELVPPELDPSESVRRIPEGVQGAWADDLRQFPPEGEICAHFRELFRDSADGDLGPETRQRVDAHLHACRACALALARSEYEKWRIVRALAALRPHLPQPSRDFTARVLERLAEEFVDESAQDSPGADAGGSLPGAAHTGDQAADVNDSGLGDSSREDNASFAESDTLPTPQDYGPRDYGPRDYGADPADSESSPPSNDLPEASVDFTDRVMDAIRGGARKDLRAGMPHSGPRVRAQGWGRALSRRRALALTSAAAMLVCAIGFAAAWLWYGTNPDAELSTRLRVQVALLAKAGDRVLQRGDLLAPGTVVTTAAKGSCLIEVPGDAALAQSSGTPTSSASLSSASLSSASPSSASPSSTSPSGGVLELGSESALRAGVGGEPLALLRGEAIFRIASECKIALGRAQVAFQPGEFAVAITPVDRIDQALSSSEFQRWRIECRHGSASLRRGFEDRGSAAGPASLTIPSGHVARFDAWSPTILELGPEAVIAQIRAANQASARGVADLGSSPASATDGMILVGAVVDKDSGKPVPGTTVRLHTQRARGAGAVLATEQQDLVCDARGEFRIEQAGALEGSFALVEVIPPESEGKRYARIGPSPWQLVGYAPSGQGTLGQGNARQTLERRMRDLELAPGRSVTGRVRDPEGRWLAGAQLRAYRHDEIVGALTPLPSSVAVSDAEGFFELPGLPTELPPHVCCVVLASAEQRVVVATLAGPLGSPCEVVLPKGLDARIVGLVPDEVVEVVEATPGLPLSAVQKRKRTRADAGGVARLLGVGPGSLWLQREPRGSWFALTATRDADGLVLTCGATTLPAAIAAMLASAPRAGLGSSAGTLLPGGVQVLRTKDRYSVLHAASGPGVGAGDRSPQSVHIVDGDLGSVGLGTEIFVVSGDGERWSFLGQYDGRRGIPLTGSYEPGSRLVAIGRDGSIGHLVLEKVLEGQTVDIALQMHRTGALELAPQVRPAAESGRQRVTLSLRILGGEFAGLTFSRYAEAASEWVVDNVPTGEYEVLFEDGRAAVCRIESRGRARLDLDARQLPGRPLVPNQVRGTPPPPGSEPERR